MRSCSQHRHIFLPCVPPSYSPTSPTRRVFGGRAFSSRRPWPLLGLACSIRPGRLNTATWQPFSLALVHTRLYPSSYLGHPTTRAATPRRACALPSWSALETLVASARPSYTGAYNLSLPYYHINLNLCICLLLETKTGKMGTSSDTE